MKMTRRSNRPDIRCLLAGVLCFSAAASAQSPAVDFDRGNASTGVEAFLPTAAAPTNLASAPVPDAAASLGGVTPAMIAAVIDHTYLKTEAEGASPEEQRRQVAGLVEEAVRYGVSRVF